MSGSSAYTTSVPAPVFGPNGYVAPAESDILPGALADISAAFGGGLNPALATPQGQIASSLTAILGDRDTQILQVLNGMDPAFATGRQQDGIARIYFISRIAAASTVVNALCAGGNGVIIPQGALAQDPVSGYAYTAAQAGTITGSGSVVIPFVCTMPGPIVCASGNLSEISQVIPGWDSITNAAAGVTGFDVETPQDFETRRGLSVAGNSVNTNQAIQGAVAAVPNVLDCFVFDNPSPSSATINGVTIPANALCVSVAGGDLGAIAAAIFSKRPPGPPMAGTTVVTVQDPNPAYNGLGPSYAVQFYEASSVGVNVQVTITNSPAVPSTALASITTAIQAAFAGTDSRPRASRIGGTVYASRFTPGIEALGTWANVVNVKVGTTSPPASDTQSMSAIQIPTLGTVTLILQ